MEPVGQSKRTMEPVGQSKRLPMRVSFTDPIDPLERDEELTEETMEEVVQEIVDDDSYYEEVIEDEERPSLFPRDLSSLGISTFSKRRNDQDLVAYAQLEIAKLNADPRVETDKSEQAQKRIINKAPVAPEEEEFPMDEPPRKRKEPPQLKPLQHTSPEYYSDPPATLIIQSLKARTSPFASSDELSDISPVLQSNDEENAIVPSERALVPAKNKNKPYPKNCSDTDKGSVQDFEVKNSEGAIQPTASLRKRGANSTYTMLVVLLSLFVVSATVYLIIYVLQYIQDKENEQIYTMGENQTTTNNTASKDFVGTMRTTPMDKYSGCNFDNYTQPHVRAQCFCNGEIEVLTTDVREKYYALNMLFISMNISNVWELSEESCDPRNQAVIWLSTTYSKDRIDLIQKYVLATLFLQMNGEQWASQELWLEDEDVCNWSGISCNDLGLVTDIFLDGNGLKGSLPSELPLLGSLERLSLWNNGIEGTLPEALFAVPSIKELNIGYNNFVGEFPSQLFQLVNLEKLNLENTALSGRLPSEVSNLKNLQFLSIANTNVRSRIPTQIGSMTKLQVLMMANSNMSGDIPSEITLLTNLNHLDLGGSGFRRTIPSFLGQMTSLSYLGLNDNAFTGSIPAELGKLSNLVHLSLNGNQLFGEIPSALGLLTLLDTLTLESNQLTGRAHLDLCKLRQYELIVFTTDCSDGSHGVLCPVPNCCTSCQS